MKITRVGRMQFWVSGKGWYAVFTRWRVVIEYQRNGRIYRRRIGN